MDLRPTVCLDFDGVIHKYTGGWTPDHDETTIPDEPTEGAREAIGVLKKHYKVVVCSARCSTERGRQAILDWLKKYDIEVDEVSAHKPPAKVYIDDRGVTFNGDWGQALLDVATFQQWQGVDYDTQLGLAISRELRKATSLS